MKIPKHKVVTLDEFYQQDGILNPIRAIVLRNSTFENITRSALEVQDALALLRSSAYSTDPTEKLEAKESWAKCINRSNIVGYFSASRDENQDVFIHYNFCKPEDWNIFNPKISKHIAINKYTNVLAWLAENGKKPVWMVSKHRHDSYTYSCIDENDDVIVYVMLGTFNDQLNHFKKRVMKYYKLDSSVE